MIESPTDQFKQDRQSLDARFLTLTRWVNGAVMVVLGIILLISGAIAWLAVPSPWWLLIVAIWFAGLLVAYLTVIWWPKRMLQEWTYQVDSDVVDLQYGVLWKKTISIPISRLQHVDMHRGPIEQRWNLATLELHTAGTRNASHRIPGLDVDVAHVLRDQLILATNRGTDESA